MLRTQHTVYDSIKPSRRINVQKQTYPFLSLVLFPLSLELVQPSSLVPVKTQNVKDF